MLTQCFCFNPITYPKIVKEKEGKNIVHESKIFREPIQNTTCPCTYTVEDGGSMNTSPSAQSEVS